jgi:hypothetical protein
MVRKRFYYFESAVHRNSIVVVFCVFLQLLERKVSSTELSIHLAQLHVWIMDFLSENKFMVRSDVGRNKLIEQVRHLIPRNEINRL